MPTIIALDTSLSMQRAIPGRNDDNPLTYHQLAVKGIFFLLEHLLVTSKLEYVALVTYSTVCEIKVDFTRDYDYLRQAVKKVEPGDKVCTIDMLKTAAGIFSTNWGKQHNYCQLVAFTDCGLGFGSTSLNSFLQMYVGKEQEPEYAWIAALKHVKLNFVCMGVHSDYYFTRATPIYQQLLDYTNLRGQLYMTKPKDTVEAGENATEGTKTSASSGISLTTSTSSHSSHKSELGRSAMFEMIDRLCEANFKPYEATLKCGGYFRLESPIIVWPPPAPYPLTPSSDKVVQRHISSKLEVCGFLSLSDIGSPASLSRHLILSKVEREKPGRRSSDKLSGSAKSLSNTASAATNSTKYNVLDASQPNFEFEKLEQDIRDFYTKDVKDTDAESGDDADATNAAPSAAKSSSQSSPNEMQKESMCVLLHGALKMENLAALVLLSDNWYGFLYSFADSKKKSNLMLNILPPGNTVIPWLGDLKMLGFAEDLMPGETAAFPVKAEKRSYSQSCVVWIRHLSLQSDIQKVLRHAKKMPEKTQHFYKELNRIRRAALSIGFVELLEAMATLFEKESVHLSISANPECSIQLKHAALELRKPSNRDLKVSILPVQKFAVAAESGGGPAVPGFVY